MKKKFLTKKSLIVMAALIFSVSLITGVVAVEGSSGCPSESGGYASRGIRVKRTCTEKVQTSGYWWYVSGEVKWVGTVFAGMGGEFKSDVREVTFTGQEYTCTGDSQVCWICNCYYSNTVTALE